MTLHLDEARTDRLLSASPLHFRDVRDLAMGQLTVLADWHRHAAEQAQASADAMREAFTMLRPWVQPSDSSLGPALDRARAHLAATPDASEYVTTRVATAERVLAAHPELAGTT